MKVLIFLVFLPLVSMATQAQAIASSAQKQQPASHAIDADFRTAWVSTSQAPQSLTVDMRENKKIKGFVYIPYLNQLAGRVSRYKIDISQDGKQWQNISSGTFKSPLNISIWPNKKDVIERISLKQPLQARWYRLTALSTENDKAARLNEFLPILVSEPEPFAGKTMASLKGLRYAPSVHLSYNAGQAQSFYNEIEVTASAPGSFFMGIGFNQGYFGIQETVNGKKWFLFSIWDSKSNDKNSQVKDKRTIVVDKDPKTRAQRFGHEGSGGQSFYDYNWQIGEKIKLLLKIEDHGARRHYKAYFYHSKLLKWVHMTTFSSVAPQKYLSRFHSFVEDFHRNYDSFAKKRMLRIHQAWVLDLEGQWRYMNNGRFSRDNNPHINITAVTQGATFNFGTGGSFKNSTAPGVVISRPLLIVKPQNLP